MKPRFLLLLLPILFCSCTRYFYAPNSHNVPGFREKGEARATISALKGDEIEGVETQFAYSPVNHLGLMFNYANAKGGSGYTRGYGHQVEGGAGYFLPVAGKSVFEVYAGYGGGNVYSQYDSLQTYSHRFGKVFLQPSIGFTSDYFDALFSLRLGYLSLHVNESGNANSAYALIEVENTPHSFLVEPGVTIRAGWKFIKVQTQFGGSYNLTNPDFPQEKELFSIGLYTSFTPRWMNGRSSRPARNSF